MVRGRSAHSMCQSRAPPAAVPETWGVRAPRLNPGRGGRASEVGAPGVVQLPALLAPGPKASRASVSRAQHEAQHRAPRLPCGTRVVGFLTPLSERLFCRRSCRRHLSAASRLPPSLFIGSALSRGQPHHLLFYFPLTATLAWLALRPGNPPPSFSAPRSDASPAPQSASSRLGATGAGQRWSATFVLSSTAREEADGQLDQLSATVLLGNSTTETEKQRSLEPDGETYTIQHPRYPSRCPKPWNLERRVTLQMIPFNSHFTKK
ncbi:uncharacterized protein LOC110210487 [Phascolarctos cinereus]|uniref:Uncharacterized protein LOC110210487 n=1 Tax=Phascolarctos cinereus TaxID=38626 RepID=A0A6P5KHL1_PHACI|nr:uncharacterized protein LOC110210487 [Phascolarctos cinereus]